MDQIPTAGQRKRRAQQHVYDGEGEQIAAPRRANVAPRRASVTKPAAPGAKKPLGRSEELQARQRVYQQEYQRPTQEQRRFRTEQSGMYNDFDVQQPERPRTAPRKMKRRDPHRGLWAVVIFLCLLCLGTLGLFLAPQLLGVQFITMPNCAFANGSIITLDNARYEDYKAYRRYMDTEAIFPGVYVDGVDVGGMTIDQARAAVGQVNASGGGQFAITVNVGNKSWSIDSSRVPMTRNLDDVLRKAHAQGRSNTTAIRGTRVTPFGERLNTALALRTNPVNLSTALTYDRNSIRSLTDEIVQYVNRPAVNAAVESFDFNTRSFTFYSDTPGAEIDGEELYNQVISRLDAGDYYATVTVEPEMLLAAVTKAELMNSFKRISTYTTETTSNANRNTNVELSANAINGRTVMPGEVFSFNEATGQRTWEKGYREAAAIAGGQSVPEVGGGVCQTSSTLFNAVARANLEIVTRSPHAWPSTYVEKGMDATVNWPNLDFKFKNNTDWPIFIVSYYNKRKVTVELYGMSLGDGVSIDLRSEVTRTIKPSSTINYVQNPNLAPGESKTTIKARTGYEVDTYKVWYQNGEVIKEELLCESRYKSYQETVEYN